MITEDTTIGASSVQSNVILIGNKEEMLKITQDAFYVRGTKVVQDDNEALKVYEAFTEWLRTVKL